MTNIHALLIGIDDYSRFDESQDRPHGTSDLAAAVGDARRVQAALLRAGVPEGNFRVLTAPARTGGGKERGAYAGATEDQIRGSIDWLADRLRRDPTAQGWLVFAGRGTMTHEGPAICASDLSGSQFEGALPLTRLARLLDERLPGRGVVAVFDAGFVPPGGPTRERHRALASKSRRDGSVALREIDAVVWPKGLAGGEGLVGGAVKGHLSAAIEMVVDRAGALSAHVGFEGLAVPIAGAAQVLGLSKPVIRLPARIRRPSPELVPIELPVDLESFVEDDEVMVPLQLTPDTMGYNPSNNKVTFGLGFGDRVINGKRLARGHLEIHAYGTSTVIGFLGFGVAGQSQTTSPVTVSANDVVEIWGWTTTSPWPTDFDLYQQSGVPSATPVSTNEYAWHAFNLSSAPISLPGPGTGESLYSVTWVVDLGIGMHDAYVTKTSSDTKWYRRASYTLEAEIFGHFELHKESSTPASLVWPEKT